MRTVVRHPILQRCFAHPAGAESEPPWRCIAFDVSVAGVGITLAFDLPRGTLLAIHPWELPGARALQARVVRAKQVDAVWFIGCELLERLSSAELQVWRSAPIDWLEKLDREAPPACVADPS
jgi:hypothetical protein